MCTPEICFCILIHADNGCIYIDMLDREEHLVCSHIRLKNEATGSNLTPLHYKYTVFVKPIVYIQECDNLCP